jgi:ABC-type transporter Mla maintaining outer membrane lipid asymmetry ATPase subunit MlaF
MPALEAVGPMTDPVVVRVESLTKRFGRVLALDRLTLDVQAGEVLGFGAPTARARRRRCGC